MSEHVDLDEKKKPREIIKDLVSQYIPTKPKGISLRLDWSDKYSLIRIRGDSLDKTIEYDEVIDFTSFAHGVLEAYRDAYGELDVIPVSFREETYSNDKVSLNLYPTGSAGIFNIFIEYKDKRK